MLGTSRNQPKLENMVVELGGEVFKGEEGIGVWMQSNLSNTYPFRVFVDAYVVLVLLLIGCTSVQASTMEQNMKLKLDVDEALVLKTFKNKIPCTFGQNVGE
eukprot:2647186-Ditylum_brightwellii.AAC.1